MKLPSLISLASIGFITATDQVSVSITTTGLPSLPFTVTALGLVSVVRLVTTPRMIWRAGAWA